MKLEWSRWKTRSLNGDDGVDRAIGCPTRRPCARDARHSLKNGAEKLNGADVQKNAAWKNHDSGVDDQKCGGDDQKNLSCDDPNDDDAMEILPNDADVRKAIDETLQPRRTPAEDELDNRKRHGP